MRLAFSIALRFLKASLAQTLLIAVGIAIGVSVQIFIGSLIQGLQNDLVNTTIGSQPQISITSNSESKLIEDYESLSDQVATLYPGVKHVSPAADGPALVRLNEENYSILIRGFSFEQAEGIYKIKEQIVDGELPDADFEALIGTDLQEETGLQIGDPVEALTNAGTTKTLTITGIFDLKVSSLNKSWVITTLDTAKSMFAYDSGITGIEMQVEDVFLADAIASDIQSDLGEGLETDNWKDQNASLLSGLNGQSVSSYMIQVFVMISVLLGIASVLAITVVQKSRQIGILKAMGIRDQSASLIFLLQGLMLGIAGAVLGILLGLGLAYAFTRFALNPDGTPVVPLFINPSFIALSAGFAVLVSTLAALIPARKSSKLNPIEVIRNG